MTQLIFMLRHNSIFLIKRMKCEVDKITSKNTLKRREKKSLTVAFWIHRHWNSEIDFNHNCCGSGGVFFFFFFVFAAFSVHSTSIGSKKINLEKTVCAKKAKTCDSCDRLRVGYEPWTLRAFRTRAKPLGSNLRWTVVFVSSSCLCVVYPASLDLMVCWDTGEA